MTHSNSMRELQDAGLSDNRFSRFDEELINKYFNDKGKDACAKSGYVVDNHFVAGSKKVSVGYGNEKAIQEYITSQVSAQAGKMELYGRLHELIELFQHGNITAERYSERHAELTEAISAHQVRPMKEGIK